MWHVTRDTWHVTHDTWHMTPTQPPPHTHTPHPKFGGMWRRPLQKNCTRWHILTNKQTDKQTDMATLWLNRPSGPIQWKLSNDQPTNQLNREPLQIEYFLSWLPQPQLKGRVNRPWMAAASANISWHDSALTEEIWQTKIPDIGNTEYLAVCG